MCIEWLPPVLRRLSPRGLSWWTNPKKRRSFNRRPITRLESLEDRALLAGTDLLDGLLNLPPIANVDIFSVTENTPLNSLVSVLANDSDPNGDPLNAQLLISPLNGLLTLNPDGTFQYIPDLGFTGVDVFSYLANDGSLGSLLPGVVTLNVLPEENQPPVANDDTFTINENSILNLSLGTILDGVLANDADPELAPLTASVVTTTQHGSLLFLPTGTFIYTPDTNFTGTDTFTYQASDGVNQSNVATATFIIDAVNSLPVANSDSFNVTADTPFNSVVSILANDVDADGDALTAQLVTPPLFGNLVLNPNGTFQYTPNLGFVGVDLFTYFANDGQSNSFLPATVTLTSTALANQPPVANNDAFSVDENSVLNLSLGTILDGVLANDTDPELAPLTASLVMTTQHGTLTFLPAGTFIYTPEANFSGVDTFTYQASDVLSLSNVATATITVNAVNSPPVANSDSFNVTADTPFNSLVSILANDVDPDGDALTAQLLTGPLFGNLILNSNGTFQYTPNLGFVGVDVFTYFANDGTTNSLLPATVTLTSTALANQPPVANNDAFSVDENSVLNLSAGTILDGVLANDTDPELVPLTASLVTTTQNGTLTLLPAGTFIYTPDPDFSGVDTFSYQASDGLSLSNVATATITVNAVNSPPVANPDSFNVPANGTFNSVASVLTNDTDSDGDALTAQLFVGPLNGTLTLNPNGTFQYTPTLGFIGIDVFTYVANDGQVSSLPTTVTLNTAAVGNQPPVANNDVFHVNEDSVLNLSAGTIANGVLANDTDAELVPLIAFLVTPPQNGSFTFLPTGTFIYTPDPNFSGTDTFTYQASDGQSLSNVATASIIVDPLNDAPTAANDSYATTMNVSLNIPAASGVLANDNDPDGNTLTAAVVTTTTNGTLNLNSSGSFVYTPNVGFTGTDTFTYRASDGLTLSNVATVTITITSGAAGVPPIANNDAYSLNEDNTLITTPANGVLFNDTDADGNPLTASLVSGPANGTLTFNANGTFTYTPDSNFNGVDSFTYQANDGTSNSNVAIVQLTVTGTNDPPIGNPDSYVTDEGEALNVGGSGVLANDVDPDGDALTAIVLTNPTNGTLALNSNGSFTYTPDADFSGTDSFTYQANDATSNSGPVTVTITINDVNAAPVSVNDAYSVDEDAVLTVPAPGVLANDTDADGDTLTVVVVTQPQNGTLVLNADGSLTYTPDADFNGSDSFTYRANDGTANGNLATVNITVGPENEAPIIVTSAGSTLAKGHKKTVLDPAIDLIDPDSPNFNGGNLDVVISSGGGQKDTLGYRKAGAKKGLVNAKKGQLRIGFTVIGTITGGRRGQPLHVEYNSNATLDRVQTAMQTLIFRGTRAQRGPRVISWQITDDTGLDSDAATKSADVT